MQSRFTNVNEAFHQLVAHFRHRPLQYEKVVEVESRVGSVAMIQEPVMITYLRPTERVLFNPARDANPFFHLYESLWMLAGRNDVAPLNYYNSEYGKITSDNGVMANGAYGYRWRHAYLDGRQRGGSYLPPVEHDQLDLIITHLRSTPNSRRAVLSMWNVEDDLLKIGCSTCDSRNKTMFFRDPGPCPTCGSKYRQRAPASKDVCCNTHAYFSLRREDRVCEPTGDPTLDGKEYYVTFLDMTVCNRSNDLVWGMLGANVVHFSFLQEYVACALGVEVGVYNQFTNNLHVYTQRFTNEVADSWLREYAPRRLCSECCPTTDIWYYVSPNTTCEQCGKTGQMCRDIKRPPMLYETDAWPRCRVPLFIGGEDGRQVFDKEVSEFVERHSRDAVAGTYEKAFLRLVAQPMMVAFHHHKRRDYKAALASADNIHQPDWRQVCVEWITRRKDAWEQRQMTGVEATNVR